MWWLLPTLLFTGARTGELVQMRLDDVYKVDGILTAHIRADEEHGQTVKTEAGKRVVPIHPVLLALGFDEYLERMRGAGHERVFEAFKLYSDKSSRSASRWFGEIYKKRFLSEGLGEGKKVLHSFRSTFITSALNNGADDRLVQQLVGHSNSKELGATAIYDKGADVPQLFEAIKKVRFDGVDFERLVDGWQGLKLK